METPYNKTDHTHCWKQENPPCGIKGKHRCCLCEESVPSTHNTREIDGIIEQIGIATYGGVFFEPTSVYREKLTKILHQELQKAREEAIAREKQLKQVHMMELDAISCMSLEQYVVWRDHRKQRPNQSELDQPTV